jgi:hypothetical protein
LWNFPLRFPDKSTTGFSSETGEPGTDAGVATVAVGAVTIFVRPVPDAEGASVAIYPLQKKSFYINEVKMPEKLHKESAL